MEDKKLVVGLEIGTSKVVAVVGQPFPDGTVEIVGVGSSPAKGISQGGITDLVAITNAIQRAIDSAADIANCEIESVVLAITGEHICSLNESGSVAIGGNDEVTQEDIDQAMTTARSIKMRDGLTLLQVIPQEFALDDLINISNPLGLQGMRLTARAHLIACNQVWLANLKKAVGACKTSLGMPLRVDRVFYSGYASAEAVLTEDEKELGVCLVDFGAGTMDISIYTHGKLRLSKSLGYAGNRITNDITYCFSTPFNEAEQVKIQYASAISPPTNLPNTEIKLQGAVPGKVIILSKTDLANVIAPRYEELLKLVRNEISQLREELTDKNIDSELIAGVVITGGVAQTQDLIHCAEMVFQSPVRIGYPTKISGLTDYVSNPSYSTVVGLLHCCESQNYEEINEDEPLINKTMLYIKRIVKKVKSEF